MCEGGGHSLPGPAHLKWRAPALYVAFIFFMCAYTIWILIWIYDSAYTIWIQSATLTTNPPLTCLLALQVGGGISTVLKVATFSTGGAGAGGGTGAGTPVSRGRG